MPTVAERPNSPPLPTPTLDTDRSVGNPSVADRAMSTSLFNPAAAVWSHGDGGRTAREGLSRYPQGGQAGSVRSSLYDQCYTGIRLGLRRSSLAAAASARALFHSRAPVIDGRK